MKGNKKILLSIIAFLALSLYPSINYAYVDLNTGGYVFQMLFPIISGIVTVYLLFKEQTKKLFLSALGLLKSLLRIKS